MTSFSAKLALGAVVIAAASAGAQAPGAYADINGIRMYYEVHGAGKPLVLLHGGGSTIKTTFGTILPILARSHRVIAVELQAHGHTSDRKTPESFRQDADDVAKLLEHLKIDSADIMGFSNGGHTAFEVALHHRAKVRRLILASTFSKRSGVPPQFWESMKNAQFRDMPDPYKVEFRKINPDPAALMNMFQKDARRMQLFKDWRDADITSITAPALVLIGDQDLTKPEHAVELYRLLPHARLAIMPGTHGSYIGEILSAGHTSAVPAATVAIIDEFLAAP